MAITNITPLPDPPSRGDAEANFVNKANAFLGSLPTFQSELNTYAGEANDQADAVDAARDAALAATNYQGEWSTLSGSLNKPASTLHEGYFWALNADVANVANEEPGTSSAWDQIVAQRGRIVESLSDITSLSSLNTAALVGGQQFYRGEFWPDTGVGAVNIKWKADEPVANHNGGTIIDPAKISDLNTTNKTFGTYFTPDTVSGNTGCFVVEHNWILDCYIFGAHPDVTDSTPAIQSAIDSVAARPGPMRGGSVALPDALVRASGIQAKDLCSIVGAGRGSSIVRAPDGSNSDIVTVGSAINLIYIGGFTIDGNRGNNTSGTGLKISDSQGGSNGNSFSPYTEKTESPPYSYKHLIISDIAVGNCPEHGYWSEPSNFQIFVDRFQFSHNGLDGLRCRSSDGVYSNGYVEKNDRSGIHGSGSANKFSSIKTIWNGRDRTLTPAAGLYEIGANNRYTTVEAQDNYCDGIWVTNKGATFYNCDSNTNGRESVSNPLSSRVNADLRIGSGATRTVINMHIGSYKDSPESDGFWLAEWPYYFDAGNDNGCFTFNVEFDPSKYNQAPNVWSQKLYESDLGGVQANSFNGSDAFLDLNVSSPDEAGNALIRFFRDSVAAGITSVDVMVPGTGNVQHRLRVGAGFSQVCRNDGDFIIGHESTGGAWDTSHPRLGPYHLWVDSTGDLRIKNGAPTSDTDGTIVGVQS